MSNPPKKTVRSRKPRAKQTAPLMSDEHLFTPETKSAKGETAKAVANKSNKKSKPKEASPTKKTGASPAHREADTSTRLGGSSSWLRWGLIGFLVAMAAIGAMAAQLVLGRATVTITPSVSSASMQTSFSVQDPSVQSQPGTTGTAATGDVIPGTVRMIEDQLTVPITGLNPKRVDDQAHGSVTISNSLNGPVHLLAATTLISESGVSCTLDTDVIVPAFGTANVSITSDGVGEATNVSPTNWTFPDLPARFRDALTTHNDQHLTGGYRLVSEVSAEDIDQAKASASTALTTKMLTALLPTTDGGPRITSVEVTSATASANPGDQVSQFDMTVSQRLIIVEPQAAAYSAFAIHALTQPGAVVGVDPTRFTFFPDDASTDLSVEQVDLEGKKATIHANLVASMVPTAAALGISAESLAGQSKHDVEKKILGTPDVQSVTIDIRPAFLSRLPLIPRRIRIIIASPRAAQD